MSTSPTSRRRVVRRVAAALCVSLASATIAADVRAEVVHDETSQSAFGFDELGAEVEGGSSVDVFREAWNRFAGTVEGARILGKIDANRGWEVEVIVIPGDQIDYPTPVWGLSTQFTNPNEDGQERVTIQVALDETRTADAIAETLYHEFRHVERWIDGDDSEHDDLHAGTDSEFVRYLGQLTGGGDAADVLAEAETPISDAIQARLDEEIRTEVSDRVGDILLRSAPTETNDSPDVPKFADLIETFVIDAVPSDFADEIDAVIEDLPPVDGTDRCVGDDDTTACGNAPAFGPSEGDLLVGGRLGGDLPIAGLDGIGLEFFVALETDFDPANDRVQQHDGDPFGGADTWFGMSLDPLTGLWSFGAWDVADGGESVAADPDSGAFGLVTGDRATIVIPHEELLTPDVRVRVAIATSIDTAQLLDVNGELPTDPMIFLDGRRGGGPNPEITESADGFNLYYGPTTVPTTGVLDAEFCVIGASGAIRTGLDVATTLGDPPDSPLASHNDGVTDENGCVALPLPVNEPEGESRLFFFDGTTVEEITTILVVSPAFVEPED